MIMRIESAPMQLDGLGKFSLKRALTPPKKVRQAVSAVVKTVAKVAPIAALVPGLAPIALAAKAATIAKVAKVAGVVRAAAPVLRATKAVNAAKNSSAGVFARKTFTVAKGVRDNARVMTIKAQQGSASAAAVVSATAAAMPPQDPVKSAAASPVAAEAAAIQSSPPPQAPPADSAGKVFEQSPSAMPTPVAPATSEDYAPAADPASKQAGMPSWVLPAVGIACVGAVAVAMSKKKGARK